MTRERAEPGLWLFKVEPTRYNITDLERDGATLWDGVTNNLARQNLRRVRKGDRVLYYHTGKEKAVVGEMTVAADPQADPASDDPNTVVVKVTAAQRWPKPVTLQQIKQDAQLSPWDLVRLPRLSVLAVTPAQWQRLQELAQS